MSCSSAARRLKKLLPRLKTLPPRPLKLPKPLRLKKLLLKKLPRPLKKLLRLLKKPLRPLKKLPRLLSEITLRQITDLFAEHFRVFGFFYFRNRWKRGRK